jgi:hypothetical protein
MNLKAMLSILFLLGGCKLSAEGLEKWISDYECVKKDTFLESVTSNRVPPSVFKGAELKSLLERLNINKADFITSYGEMNGVFHAYQFPKNRIILFFGTPVDRENGKVAVGQIFIVEKVDKEEVDRGLVDYFKRG